MGSPSGRARWTRFGGRWRAGSGGGADPAFDEGGDPPTDVVGHGAQIVPEAGVGDELGIGELGDGRPEQIEPGEGVALAGQKERRTADRRPVLGPEARFGSAGTVERIGEADEAADLRQVAGCDEAGDAAAEGVTAENDEAIGG